MSEAGSTVSVVSSGNGPSSSARPNTALATRNSSAATRPTISTYNSSVSIGSRIGGAADTGSATGLRAEGVWFLHVAGGVDAEGHAGEAAAAHCQLFRDVAKCLCRRIVGVAQHDGGAGVAGFAQLLRDRNLAQQRDVG